MAATRKYANLSSPEARAIRESDDPDEVVAARHNISVADVQTARRKIIPMPERGYRPHLTREEVMAIRQDIRPVAVIAKAYGRSTATIYNLITRRTRRDIAPQLGDVRLTQGRRRGVGKFVTEAEVLAIRNDPRKAKAIQRDYPHISLVWIYKIRSGKARKLAMPDTLQSLPAPAKPRPALPAWSIHRLSHLDVKNIKTNLLCSHVTEVAELFRLTPAIVARVNAEPTPTPEEAPDVADARPNDCTVQSEPVAQMKPKGRGFLKR